MVSRNPLNSGEASKEVILSEACGNTGTCNDYPERE